MQLSRFDQVINRKKTDSVKWDYTKRIFGVEDVLPMWVADMDFPAPEEVIDALHTRVDHGIFGYTMPGSKMEESVKNWLDSRHSWKIDPKTITYSPGIVTAISMAIHAFTTSEDKIVVQPPVYYPFFEIAQKHKREVLYNQLLLNEEFRYEIDFNDLEEKLSDERTTLFILCNPHNPSGRVWSKEELTRIGDLCIKHNVLIISDDIHSDLLLFGNQYTPIASIRKDIANQTITCIAPSKTFNLAAYEHGSNWLDELIQYLQENVLLIEEYLMNHLPQVKIMRPESTYLVWIDARNVNKSDKELQELLLNKGKLALHIGSKFGKNGEGFLRMNIACPKETLLDGLKRLKIALT